MEDPQDRTNVMNDKNLEWFQLMGTMGLTAACYPFEYVKFLIQIGHEPIPPKPTRTLLGRPALALPGVFTYMKHIRKVDGFWGLYRGLWPKICTNLISISTYKIVHEQVPDIIIDREEIHRAESEVTDEQKFKLEMNALLRSSVARCITIVVSHPFQVITIRTVAQFIGREEKYGGIFGSLIEIYQQDGILGYFSGLVPRILGEMFSLWLATLAASVINTYLVEEETLKSYVRASMCYLSNALFYPFQVVSNVSIVNNCGLRAGLPSNMPIYSDWIDCWSHLKAMGQLKRGSSTLLRYYNGPYASSMLSDPTGRRIERMYFAASETSGRSVHDKVFRYNMM